MAKRTKKDKNTDIIEGKEPRKRRWRMTRRGFLIGAGTTGALVAGGLYFGLPLARLQLAEVLDGAGAPFGVDAEPTTWFVISPDNKVRLYVPKVEMGQGIHTAFAQIAAEELEVAWEDIEVIQASTQVGPQDAGGTGGSGSVAATYTSLREAGAMMREMLKAEASKQMGVAVADLTASEGIISADGNSMTYGEIVADTAEWVIPEEAPALKHPDDFKVIGQSKKRVDFRAKLLGEAKYGYDMILPNMVYGAVARPQTIEGKMISAKPGEAETYNGVIQVVIEDDFAGVVAETRPDADLGRNRLDIEWDEGKLWQQEEIDAMVTVGEGKAIVIQREGDIESEFKNNTKSIVAEYRSPMAAHAHLEPQAALVDVQDDKITAYVSSQFPNSVAGYIADALGVDEDIVDVTAAYLGGGFGRKLNATTAVDAARLSKAVGRPVHVGWNRREEFRNGFLRPPTHHLLKATLDDNNKLTGIDHQQASGDVAFPFFPSIAIPVLGADFGAWRGSRVFYDVPNIRTVAWRTPLPLATGWWRGLGLLCNTFALESFIDEIAHAAGADPLQFRLDQLGTDKVGTEMRAVLERTAELGDWGSALPEGRARGVACSMDVGTPAAQIAEVSIENGKIRVHKVACAVDPHVAINPDGISAQTQGSIIMGMSSTFFEKITIKDGKIDAANFDKYPLITMKEAPEIKVGIVESGGEPTGMGEPPIGPIAAAIGNAVFALTGQRLRELPLQLS